MQIRTLLHEAFGMAQVMHDVSLSYNSNLGGFMDTQENNTDTTEQPNLENNEAIESALQQMEVLYRSRCVQPPLGSNITIREIKKEE